MHSSTKPSKLSKIEVTKKTLDEINVFLGNRTSKRALLNIPFIQYTVLRVQYAPSIKQNKLLETSTANLKSQKRNNEKKQNKNITRKIPTETYCTFRRAETEDHSAWETHLKISNQKQQISA